MPDILAVAEQLNSEVNRLNNERSKLEGKLESAKSNYEKAVKAYEVKYGVKLTEETLQSEYNEVFARTKGAILDLQEKVESIKRGDYKKNDEPVEFELEPDVEPIRGEKVEAKTEKPKRGRKPKAKPAEIENADEIAPTPSVETTPSVKDSESISIPEGPFNFNLGMEDAPAPQPKVEEPQKVAEVSKGPRKPLSTSDLSALLKESENAVQQPVSFPDAFADDDDDASDINEMPFGVNPNMGVEESKPEEVPTEAPDSPLDFSNMTFNFGDFPSLDDAETSSKPVAEPKKTDEIVDLPTFGGFDMGMFEDIGSSDTKKAEPKKEEKTEGPITPDGWGGEFKFDMGNLDNILNSSGFGNL